jgi:DNA-binding response OmpR family regulator
MISDKENKMAKSKTIMIMHKDFDTRRAIKTLLESNGYAVVEVVSFEDFKKKISRKIDLVLINGLMPRTKMVGMAQKKGVNVAYFLSDDVNEEELKLYKNVLGHIDEPRDINKFLTRIKELLG